MATAAGILNLYLYNFKDENGKQVLIGQDPVEIADQLYQWPDQPGGWERRQPWTTARPIEEVAKAVVPAAGKGSGWPGARRPVGRPRNKESEPTVLMAIVVSEVVYARILARAAAADQLLGEWVVAALRGLQPSAAEAVELGARSGQRVTMRMRIPKAVMIAQQAPAAAARMLFAEWLSAVVAFAAKDRA